MLGLRISFGLSGRVGSIGEGVPGEALLWGDEPILWGGEFITWGE